MKSKDISKRIKILLNKKTLTKEENKELIKLRKEYQYNNYSFGDKVGMNK